LADVLKERDFILTASSPEYIGRFGLRVLQRTSPASRASVRIRRPRADSKGGGAAAAAAVLELRTGNVRRLSVAPDSELLRGEIGGAGKSTVTIDVDGARITVDKAAGVELCRGEVKSSLEATCAAGSSSAAGCESLAVAGGLASWAPCALPALRGSSLLGPIRRVFAAPWVVVVPDDPTPLETRLATYFANGHLIAVDTATQVLPLTSALALRDTRHFVWLGNALRFPSRFREPWPVRLEEGDQQAEVQKAEDATWPSSLTLGPCAFQGPGHGAAFLAPVSEAESGAAGLLDLVVTATGPQALIDLVSFSFATNQPHTRAPMSNMLPDFVVTGPEFRWRGYGGMLAAGYFDEAWRVAPNSAYLHC